MNRYIHNLAVSVDQLANTLLAGYPLAHNQHHCELAFAKEIDLPEDVYGKSWDKKY